jgi:Putative addiction module component
MSTLELKEKIHDYIELADDKVLEAIYTLLEANVNQYTLTDKQISIVEERLEQYHAGTSKTYDWEEVKKMIGKKA